jgi:putative colanic acid biosynthesis acetyltransferase WcaF
LNDTPHQLSASPRVQDLAAHRLPKGFRGRSALYVQLWWIVQASFFHTSPQIFYPWRRWLLRLFGAKVGARVRLRPSVTITYPWKVSIGDNAWIGDNATLYSLAPISIGTNTVISQGAYLCGGSHDYRDVTFRIYGEPIMIEPEAWIAAQAFVHPGVTVGRGAIVGACSVVTKDVAPYAIVAGNPAIPMGSRLPEPR